MKPFVVGWALETGRVKPDTPINASAGSVVVSGIPIKDAHHYGTLSVREVIQKSSNIGTVRMAMQMQPRELWELYSSVGYGQKPQISFPGAVTGRLVIGLPPSVSRTLTGPLVRTFRERFPEASFGVVEGLSDHLLEWLAVGRVDFALVYSGSAPASIELAALRVEPIEPAQNGAARSSPGSPGR